MITVFIRNFHPKEHLIMSPNAPQCLLYTTMTVHGDIISSSFKEITKWWKTIFVVENIFIITEWISLQLMPPNNQIVANYLSLFYYWLQLHFRIKFKLLNKYSIDNTPNHVLEVYLAIASTNSYLDNILNWNYQNQLLLFSKRCAKQEE